MLKMFHSENQPKKKPSRMRTTEKLVNPVMSQYQNRLTNEEKQKYTDLFNENSSDGKVKKENFLPLLGFFGTKVPQDFSDRMFYVLSEGKQELTLDQYLYYINIYHYGDINERCFYTFKLMDSNKTGKIELKDFQSYINLIINTVKKVNNTSSKNLMTDKDIEILFFHISKGNSFFDYNDL